MSPVAKTKVVIYARVSTEEQARSGLSIDSQLEKLRLYCQLHELEVVAELVDDGESAKDLNRPALQEALSLLRSRQADGLVVAKLDRLSRSVKDWNALVECFFNEKAGRKLMSVTESIDTRTASGRMALNMLMVVSQWEREAISERTRDAMAQKRVRNEQVGEVPFGFKVSHFRQVLGKHGEVRQVPCLSQCDREQRVLARMRELRAGGQSYRQIAEILTLDGVPTKTGKNGWGYTSVRKILTRVG